MNNMEYPVYDPENESYEQYTQRFFIYAAGLAYAQADKELIEELYESSK